MGYRRQATQSALDGFRPTPDNRDPEVGHLNQRG